MTKLPPPPPEVAADRSLEHLAPKFRDAVNQLLAALGDAKVSESHRTLERQAFLYGFGRDYDDGRGIVTNAASNLTSWHGYGLAVDIVHATKEWDAGEQWFRHMGATAASLGLSWGGNWHRPDLPHVQWGKCRDTPSDHARELFASGGLTSVWLAVEAA